ncbi:MAG TPA: FecR domain-containing protein [Puia sp.]
MRDRPDRKLLVQKAVSLLEATRLQEKEPSPEQQQRAEAALWEKIASLDTAATYNVSNISRKISVNRLRWIAAASLLVLVTAGVLLAKYAYNPRHQIRTPFGQIAREQLPDGTEVTMNANSSLRYGSDWNDKEDREVWVDGEAYFHVKRTQSNSRFIVHTEHFQIIVTGTQFNVSNRHGKDNVLLQEGSVTLRTRDGKTIMMQPGDFVTYDSTAQKKAGCSQTLLAWKDQMLILDHTPISQLATMITDQYGTHVRLEGDSTPFKTVTGMMSNDNLNRLMKSLEYTGEYDIVHDSLNNEVIISWHRRKS